MRVIVKMKMRVWTKMRMRIAEEENKIIIDDVKKNRDKIFELDEYSKFVIQRTHKRSELNDAVKVIVNFNEVLSLDLT